MALTRKNALFAGHEVGAENWALLASIVATCKPNGVDPVAYITHTLTAIIDGHPQSRIDDLMPWRFQKPSSGAVSAIGDARSEEHTTDLKKLIHNSNAEFVLK